MSWKPIPNFQIDRSKPFPQYINGIKATYLLDPGGTVTSVGMEDVASTTLAVEDVPSVPIEG